MNKEDYLRTEIRDGYQVSVTRKKFGYVNWKWRHGFAMYAKNMV